MKFSFKQFLLLTIFSLAGNVLFSQDFAGVVKDSISGKEIAMATVTIIETDQSAVTDLNGRFKFKMKGEGVFTIKVESWKWNIQACYSRYARNASSQLDKWSPHRRTAMGR